jgi:hypothetical protein
MLQCEKYHSAEMGAFNQPPSFSMDAKNSFEPLLAADS